MVEMAPSSGPPVRSPVINEARYPSLSGLEKSIL